MALPDSPDYAGLTSQGNNDLFNLNRPNQTNPFASSTWSVGPGGQTAQNTQLSAPEQGLLGQRQAQNTSLGAINQGLLGQASNAYSQPQNYDASTPWTNKAGQGDFGTQYQAATDASYNQARRQLDPQWEQADTDLRTQLTNAGIPMNSEAWDKAVASQGAKKAYAYGDARDRAAQLGTQLQNQYFNQDLSNAGLNNAGRQQANAEANYLRGGPTREIAANNAAMIPTGIAGSGTSGAGGASFAPVPQLTPATQLDAAKLALGDQASREAIARQTAITQNAQSAQDEAYKAQMLKLGFQLMPDGTWKKIQGFFNSEMPPAQYPAGEYE